MIDNGSKIPPQQIHSRPQYPWAKRQASGLSMDRVLR